MVGTMGGRMRTTTHSGGVYAQVENVAVPDDASAARAVQDVVTEFLRSKSGQGFLQLFASIQTPTNVRPDTTPSDRINDYASDPLASAIHPKEKKLKPTKANDALTPIVVSEGVFCSSELRKHAFYADNHTLIFNMDVNDALELLAHHEMVVNCIVTSPPFYGQRDYEVDGQIGLEEHPSEFITKLVDTFDRCGPILAENGSLWVNLGDKIHPIVTPIHAMVQTRKRFIAAASFGSSSDKSGVIGLSIPGRPIKFWQARQTSRSVHALRRPPATLGFSSSHQRRIFSTRTR